MRRAVVAILFATGLMIAWSPPARAIDLFGSDNCGSAEQCAVAKEKKLVTGSGNIAWKIVSNTLIILGGVSAMMIVVGGLRFVFSAGDPAKVTSAKHTILYAVIGLVVAIMASAIVLAITNAFT